MEEKKPQTQLMDGSGPHVEAVPDMVCLSLGWYLVEGHWVDSLSNSWHSISQSAPRRPTQPSRASALSRSSMKVC